MIQQFFLSIIAVLPLLIWFIFFWIRDYKKKEPAFWIILTILLGGGAAFLSLYSQIGFNTFLPALADKIYAIDWSSFLTSSFVEEFFKFLVVFIIFKINKDFDEPIDFMIYMIFAGIGFGIVENLVAIIEPNMLITQGLQISLMRMITADLLHIIACGILGFFWAWSYAQRKSIILYLGFALTVIYHACYNLIITIFDKGFLLNNLLFIIVSAIIIVSLFNKVSEFKINFKKLEYETR